MAEISFVACRDSCAVHRPRPALRDAATIPRRGSESIPDRSRSTPASGLQVTRANIWPVSRSTDATCATASPAGYVPSMPDVTSLSPGWISAFGDRKRSSGSLAGPGAVHDAAKTAALDLDRHRVILVGHQRHLGHIRKYARDLADDADLVDHGLAELHARHVALVDEELLRERIAARVEHFGGDRGAGKALGHLEQRAQLRVFLVERADKPCTAGACVEQAAPCARRFRWRARVATRSRR